MNAALVAGIDSSTQSTTVVLRNLDDGAIAAMASSRHPGTTPPVSEQDPASWWSALREAMGAALAAARSANPSSSVVAASVDAQAHGLVPVDETGTVIRPAKLWNDTTSAAEARELVDRLGRPEWVRRSGSVPPAAFTISKVLWLARHEPENFRRIRQLLLPHDWLTYQMTGDYLTDPSDASGTGYYNPVTGKWDPALLELIHTDIDWASRLPRLLAFDEAAGTLTADAASGLGLGQDTVVGPGAADNQAAAIGMGIRPGDVVVSLGTSGVVYTRAEEAVLDLSGAVNGNADATGHFLPVVCTLNAAKVTDTFTRLLAVGHDQLAMLALQAPVRDPQRPVMAAFLDGERVPDRPDASGTLTGLRSDTTREQIARAAYEGVLAGLVQGLAALTGLGVPTGGRLAITGGGARSAAYRQLLADLTGRPVHIVNQSETAAAGAAVQAAAVHRGISIDDLATAWAPGWQVVAEPRPGADPDLLMVRYRTVADWQALEHRPTTPIPLNPNSEEK